MIASMKGEGHCGSVDRRWLLTKFGGGICSVYRRKCIENWDKDMEDRLVI